MAKKLIACLLSFCLVATGAGFPRLGFNLEPVFAAVGTLQPATSGAPTGGRGRNLDTHAAQAALLFKETGVLKGDEDPVWTYLFDDKGAMTSIGVVTPMA